ncbi:hypothetical protein [Janthinobacterium sp. UMAB-56]|uniref:hypothetical protein n=1 Tax=Janthinobacterium sp. UMAB-56 TaxID=1365361 RepID=UPI001C57F0A7|nr:hypothetical protein [Janthinobacterium sp. UMAB-56]
MFDPIYVTLCVSLVIYFFSRKLVFNILDPVIAGLATIAMSASLVYSLYGRETLTTPVVQIFAISVLGYLVGIYSIARSFSLQRLRHALSETVDRFDEREIIGACIVALVLTLLLAGLAVIMGGAGDARQDFAKTLRPLAILQGGVILPVYVLLLSKKIRFLRRLLVVFMLVLLSIPFSGKSVFFPMLAWIGMVMYLDNRKVSVKLLFLLGLATILPIYLVAVIGYGSSGLSDVVSLLMIRFLLSGDVYIFAYQNGGLDIIRSYYKPGFLSYILHPITALIGFRAYDKPLGSMIASQFTGRDLITGPNPQLPVLFDFFFPHSRVISFFLSFFVGLATYSTRLWLIRSTHLSRRYLQLGIAAMAIFLPGMAFADVSLFIMGLIGITAGVFFLAGANVIFGTLRYIIFLAITEIAIKNRG